MYDRSGHGRYLRKYVHLSLALWHNFKWASSRIIQVFGRDFIAPLFHQIWPDRTIDIKNMSHSATTTILSYMRLSYPSFKSELKEQMQTENLSNPKTILLRNLWYLMEYFIPVVHDFYICLKFNDSSKTIEALYKLFVVCCMLHNIKQPGSRGSHNYPKIQLVHLLILQYWKENKSSVFEMMKHNTGIFNEELGETTFSILSRCVLGDTILDNFDHMSKMYSLLPILRDLKDDVLHDIGVTTSITWRHTIPEACDEVVSTGLFFKRTITQIVRGTYKVYGGDSSQFKKTSLSMVRSDTPNVYMQKNQLESYVGALYDKIKSDIHTYFIARHHSPWSWSNNDGSHFSPQTGDELELDDELSSIDPEDGDEMHLFEESDNVVSEMENLTYEMPSFPSYTESVDDHVDDSKQSVEDSPYLNRSWRSWGTVDSENIMYGRRQRVAPRFYTPSKRRIRGQR